MKRTFSLLASVGTLAIVLSACSTSSTPSTPQVNSQPGSNTTAGAAYFVKATVAVPNVPATGSWFDISFIDPSSGNYILADQANAGVTVASTSTFKYLMTVGGSSVFQGTQPVVSGNRVSGPDGIVAGANGVVYAGDGNSNLVVVNIATNTVLTNTPAGCANTHTNGKNLSASSNICGVYTGGQFRLDEGGYDPTDNVVLFMNDEDNPPFGTIFTGAAPFTPTKVAIPHATQAGGAEQPIFDKAQGVFLVTFPGSTVSPNDGEVDKITPTGVVTTLSTLTGTGCAPAGNALNPANEAEFLGCGGNSLVVISATTGAVLATINGVGGCDEAWYNAKDNRFYAACSNNPASQGGPVIAAVDGTSFALIAKIPGVASAHSLAVDPATNNVFVPMPGAGGVNVYSHN